MAINFFGPNLKVERAEHHIRKLESIFRHYVRDNAKRLRPKRNNNALKAAASRRNAPTFPRHTPTVLGDAIHNLRASLDHAYCILLEANGGTVDQWTKFPFGGDKPSLEGSINGQKHKPSDAVVRAILDRVQPYKDGRLGLYGLHALDITDKHHTLIPTVAVAHFEHLDFVDAAGNKTGLGFRNVTFVSHQGGPEFLGFSDGGGSVTQDNPKTAFDIFFADGVPFEGLSILNTLVELKDNVVNALNIIHSAGADGK